MYRSGSKPTESVDRLPGNEAREATQLGTTLSAVLLVCIVAFATAALLVLRGVPDPAREARRAAVAAVLGGLVGASFVEIVKRATSLRGALQQRDVLNFFGTRVARALRNPTMNVAVMEARPESEVSESSRGMTPDRRRALYLSSSVDELSAQLSQLADRATSMARHYPGLVTELVGEAHDSVILEFGERLDSSRRSRSTGPTDVEASQDIVEAAAELQGTIEARITTFQATTDARWRLILRLSALSLSTLAAGLIATGLHLRAGGVLTAIAAGTTLGAVTAWAANDLLSVLHRFAR